MAEFTLYCFAQWWGYHESIRITQQLMGERMYPLALEGLDRGMRVSVQN
jgi:uncharacterized protein with von Willebrand factor type A (vWA) domain